MKIDKILAGIRESQSATKTASEPTPAPVAEKTAAAQPALVNALNDALASQTKTAAAPVASPVDDVMKVAQEMAGVEKEAAVKEAQILGAAFADAAISRLNEWNKTAAEMLVNAPVKTAAPVINGDFSKFAQENPELVQQAAQLGYQQATADLEKQAEDSYVQGYNDTVETIHKTAVIEFLKAASVTQQIIKASTAAK